MGSALDNAVIESWHSTVEFELRSLEHFTTKAQARRRVPAWIDEYNHDRRHSSLGMRSPVTFEHQLAAQVDQREEMRPHEVVSAPARPAWRRPRLPQGHALRVASGQP